MDATRATTFELCLRLGDSSLVLGQRLAEWTAHGPALEEDLALTNTALDLIGHARLWLDYAGECEGLGRDADRLAYFRDQHEFRNVLLVERTNGDYADTMARQLAFDAWHHGVLQALAHSSDERVAAIASKTVREVAYHLRRSADWVVRLGDGTERSHARMQAALDDVWSYTGELFAPDDVDRALLAAGIGCDLEALRVPWRAQLEAIARDATLALPADGWMHSGGKQGRHTERLGYLLAELQSVARAVPAERW